MSNDMLKKMYTYKWITRKMRGMGVYYQSCVLWPPHWAPPLLHPLAPPPLTSPTISLSFAHLADVNML